MHRSAVLKVRQWSLAAACLLLTACGGGGGSSDRQPPAPPPAPPSDPFGLTSRASLADFELPGGGGSLGSYDLVARFPNLSFSSATFVTGVPGDGRLVVMEQAGRLLAFDNDPSATSTTEVLDISSEVLFSGEQGLIGLAFDPDFASNRYLYVHYSAGSPRRSVIARFTWDAATDSYSFDFAASTVVVSNNAMAAALKLRLGVDNTLGGGDDLGIELAGVGNEQIIDPGHYLAQA